MAAAGQRPLLVCLALLGSAALAEVRLDGDSLAHLPAGVVAHRSVTAETDGAVRAFRCADGGLTVPTAGHLSAASGSVDLRCRMPQGWPVQGDRSLFHVGEQAHVHVTLLMRNGGLMAVYKGGEAYFASINSGLPATWQPGSWHRIQFSWQAEGEEVTFLLLLDGKLIGLAGGRLITDWPARCTVGARGDRAPWGDLVTDVVLSTSPIQPPDLAPGRRTVTVDAGRELGDVYRFWTVGNFNQTFRFTDPGFWRGTRRDRPFTNQVNAVYLLGGRYVDKNLWYLGVGPDGAPRTDFSGMIAQLKALLDAGFTPWPVLDNVPYAMSDPPTESTYGNTAPPRDERLWHRYVEAALRAMVGAFGRETVAKWWFRVGTEPDLKPGHWSGTKEQWLAHYDYTVDAVTRVVPEAKIGPGNILNPAEGEFGRQSDRLWGLDIIDHAATGRNACTGGTGTRLDWFSYSWYGRVGQSLSVFDQAANYTRERLRRHPTLADTPVIIGEFAVLHDEQGRRLWAGDTTEWSASFYAALAARTYAHGIRQVYEWSHTTGGVPHPRAQVLTMLESVAGGRRLAVEVASNSAADAGAIAARQNADLYVLVYNHRPLRKPKVTETIDLVVRDPRMRDGQSWRLTEQCLDADHGVWAYAFEQDCLAAGLQRDPKLGRFEGSVGMTWGQQGAALFRRNLARYQQLAALVNVRTAAPLPVAEGAVRLTYELPGHSVRWLKLTPPEG